MGSPVVLLTPDVCAIELLEFPKEIPMANRSSATAVSAALVPCSLMAGDFVDRKVVMGRLREVGSELW